MAESGASALGSTAPLSAEELEPAVDESEEGGPPSVASATTTVVELHPERSVSRATSHEVCLVSLGAMKRPLDRY
jgi:hypothetical protein